MIRASIARSIETLLTAAVLLIALTGNAQAYVRTRPNGGVAPARWTRPEVLLALDERELPPDLSANEVRKVLREVAAEWSAPAVSCTAMQVRLQQGMQASSGAATVSFRGKHWCQDGVRGTGQCYDSGSAARTTLRFGTVLPDSHEIAIVGAEIDLNAVNFDWATRAAPRTDPRGRPILDLNLALRHEIGHLLGLAHVCDPNPAGSTTQRNDRGIPVARCGASPEAVQLALMAPGADVAMPRSTQTAFVGPDEVSALCRIYPAPRSAFRRYPLTLALLLAIWVVVFVWRRQRAQP